MTRVEVVPVRCLKDNYAYLVLDLERGAAAVVDPSEAAPVEAELGRRGLRLEQVWNTHHHHDHVGGNLELAARHQVEIFASAPDWGRVPGQTRKLDDGDRFDWAGELVEALLIPGHTLGHVA
jgi:hydroxyacylglutathione hydrolase